MLTIFTECKQKCCEYLPTFTSGKEQLDSGPRPTILNAVTETLESVRVDEGDMEYRNEHSSLWQASEVVMLEVTSWTDAEYFITFWLTPVAISGGSYNY